jgi:hypothetical protein
MPGPTEAEQAAANAAVMTALASVRCLIRADHVPRKFSGASDQKASAHWLSFRDYMNEENFTEEQAKEKFKVEIMVDGATVV